MPQSHDDAAPMSTSALAAQSLQADVQSGSRDADTSSRASSSTRRTSAYVVPSIASHSQSLRPSLLLSARKTSSKGVASAAAITTAEGALPHSSEPHEPLFPFVIQPSSSSSSMINRSTREGDPESRRDRKHSTSPKGKGKARAADIASERETTAAPDAEGRRYAIDVSPLRTRSRRNSDTSQTSAPTHASSSSSRKSHRSVALSSDGLDDYEQVSIPAVGEQDPRTILREQLARTESFRTTVSSTLKGKGKAIAGHIAEPELSHGSHAYGALADGEHPLRPARHYYILSTAGKPIFSSRSRWRHRPAQQAVPNADVRTPAYESEEALNSRVGVIQALISLFAIDDDKIRYIDAGQLKIAFLLKSPIYLVAASEWGEPETVLRTHLEYLYLQTLSIVSLNQLQSIFSRRSNYDLRQLLEGAEPLLHGMVASLQHSFDALFGTLSVLPMNYALREDCTTALKPPTKQKNALYALLLSGTTLLTLLRPKTHTVHPSDLHVLLNTISSSTSLRSTNVESWLPICLPRWNSKGFVYAMIVYPDLDIATGNVKDDSAHLDLGIVLVSDDKDSFFAMKEWKDSIVQNLTRPAVAGGASLAQRLQAGFDARASFYPSVPGVRHYLYRSRTYVQLLEPLTCDPLYNSVADKRRLDTLYQTMHDSLHPPKIKGHAGGHAPARLVYVVGEHEAVLALSSSHYELFVALPPLVPKRVASEAAAAIVNFIRRNETKLFLTTAPHF